MTINPSHKYKQNHSLVSVTERSKEDYFLHLFKDALNLNSDMMGHNSQNYIGQIEKHFITRMDINKHQQGISPTGRRESIKNDLKIKNKEEEDFIHK